MGLQWREPARANAAAESAGDWFAAQVWAGREQLSASHLRARGYEIFLPHYVEHRRWSDRVKKIDRALFPGYLFLRLGGDRLAGAITAPGVIRIVGDGQQPAPIPVHEIEAVRRIVATDLAVEPFPMARVGERVRIVAGPLRDVEGVVLSTRNGHRLVVSISLLQRSVAVEVDMAWVQRCSPFTIPS